MRKKKTDCLNKLNVERIKDGCRNNGKGAKYEEFPGHSPFMS